MAGPLTEERRLEVERLLRAGHSDLAIQRELRVDRGTAARHRKRLGLAPYLAFADGPSCRYGHPYPENAVRYGKDPGLRCRECTRIRQTGAYRPVVPDWAAVERAVSGDPPRWLTPRERAAAVLRLAGTLPPDVIASRVRCRVRSVYRIVSRLKSEPEEVAA
jgi:hypothetical protein